MSESKHTPGPWTIAAGRYLLAITPAQTKQIAIFDSDDDWEDEQQANARLIAAAPELLEALEECLTCEFPVIDRDAVSKARAAIAKATGKEGA